jgi:hypothetical protein
LAAGTATCRAAWGSSRLLGLLLLRVLPLQLQLLLPAGELVRLRLGS